MDDDVYTFCKDAEQVSINTKNIGNMKEKNISVNYETDEIMRSRYSTDLDCIFDLELNVKKGATIINEIEYMHTIEMFYPGVFSWRFNGKHIECLGVIPMKKEHLGIFGRYRGIYGFISLLRKRILEILKMREYENIHITMTVKNMILATGSINIENDLYVVDIEPTDTYSEILKKANNRTVTTPELKELNMKFWVKEINPDIHHGIKEKYTEKWPITADVFTKYPPCIKKIAMQKKKGNYARFLLSTYLLKVHNDRDAKHQLLTMLDDEERSHIISGNCKDQWRAIIAKEYSAPSCKTMIEHGYCEGDCARTHPVEVLKEDKPKKTKEIV